MAEPVTRNTREALKATAIGIVALVGIVLMILWTTDPIDTSGDGGTRTFAECVNASEPGWRIEECDPN